MALGRKFLAAMGLEEEKIDSIIEEHVAATDALKKERDGYKEKAAQYDEVKKQLDNIKKDDWKAKYEEAKKELDGLKASNAKRETLNAKETAYRKVLEAIGVPEKRHNAIIRLTDLDKIELDADGKVKDEEALKKAATEDWSDYVVTNGEHGVHTDTPPNSSNQPAKKTKEQIMAIKDREERTAEIARNLELFQ